MARIQCLTHVRSLKQLSYSSFMNIYNSTTKMTQVLQVFVGKVIKISNQQLGSIMLVAWVERNMIEQSSHLDKQYTCLQDNDLNS